MAPLRPPARTAMAGDARLDEGDRELAIAPVISNLLLHQASMLRIAARRDRRALSSVAGRASIAA